MKRILKVLGGAALIGATAANAAFTAPDLSSTVTDMGTAFTAVLGLVVAGLGYKFIRRMFV